MKEKLAGIFCTVLRLTPEDIKSNPTFGKTERWDSLKHMNLVASIEQAFEIELSLDEIVAMRSFEESCSILKDKLGRAAS